MGEADESANPMDQEKIAGAATPPPPKDDYEVGYGRPPKSGQIRKGEVRNPRGPKKGSKSHGDEIAQMLSMPVPVIENGKRRNISSSMATLLKLRESALKGNARAMDKCLALAAQQEDRERERQEATTIGTDDLAILNRAIERHVKAALDNCCLVPAALPITAMAAGACV